MKEISIYVPPYRGKNPKKQAEYLHRVSLATRIEDLLALHIKERTSAIVTYGSIADILGCDKDTVRVLLQTAGGGENGITL